MAVLIPQFSPRAVASYSSIASLIKLTKRVDSLHIQLAILAEYVSLGDNCRHDGVGVGPRDHGRICPVVQVVGRVKLVKSRIDKISQLNQPWH